MYIQQPEVSFPDCLRVKDGLEQLIEILGPIPLYSKRTNFQCPFMGKDV